MFKDIIVRRYINTFNDKFTEFKDSYCYKNNPTKSAFLNAISMAIPAGEDFFIKSLQKIISDLKENNKDFNKNILSFIGQEANHKRIHNEYNKQLSNLGYKNYINISVSRTMNINLNYLSKKINMATIAATEHITTISALWLLNELNKDEDIDEKIKNMWIWHSLEELEHKSVAYDFALEMNCNKKLLVLIFYITTFNFISSLLIQTIENMRTDKTLYRLSTIFEFNDLVKSLNKLFIPWLSFQNKDFHPNKDHGISIKNLDWFDNNGDKFEVILNKTLRV